MRISLRCTTRLVALSITAATLLATIAATQVSVASPDGRNQVTVDIHDGGLYYSLNRDTHPLFLPSRLGMAFRNAKALLDSLRITDTTRSTHDETWTQPWGEVARVRDHHNELRVRSEEHTSELQSPCNLVCRLLLEKKKEMRTVAVSSPLGLVRAERVWGQRVIVARRGSQRWLGLRRGAGRLVSGQRAAAAQHCSAM